MRVATSRLKVDTPVPIPLAMLEIPSNVAPSKNCTVPAGSRVPLAAVTVAVNVTAPP